MPTIDKMRNAAIKLEMVPCRFGLFLAIPSDRCVGDAFIHYGEYSNAEVELLQALLRPGMWAIDGGANIGALTVPMAQAVTTAGKVIAIEPQPLLVPIVAANVAINGVNGQTVVIEAGLGKAKETMFVPAIDYAKPANYGGFRLDQFGSGYAVQVITLDGLDLPQCDFIKLDVEAMEVPALQGAAETIKKFRPIMLVEADKPACGQETIKAVLDLNYDAYWFTNLLYAANNFYENPENIYDLQCSFNMLCVPKEKHDAICIEGLHRVRLGDPIGVAKQIDCITTVKRKYNASNIPVIACS